MSSRDHKDYLLTEVRETYGVGPLYANAYIDYWSSSTGRRYATLSEILGSRPPKPMWFDFALTSNQRGEQTYRRIAPHIPPWARSYLDVGCGFGGFLVAFSMAGMQVKGIEIDPVRIDLAQANCQDHGLYDCIVEASILDDGISERLGTFDVITCNDVIEHVSDARGAIENMTRMLNPGGLLFMEIPNKDSLRFVARDGHFDLFSISLLDREDAIAYHRSGFAFSYDVGEYFPLEFYWAVLVRAGCEPRLLPTTDASPVFSGMSVRRAIEVLEAFFAFLLDRSSRTPATTRRKLLLRFLSYFARIVLRFLPAVLSRQERERFRMRYLTDFWSMLALKGG